MAKILVVDDEADIRELLKLYFMNKGHVVYTASNGEEGLERGKEHLPEVVFCDYTMPKKNGYELAIALRAYPELADVPIVSIGSSLDSLDERERQVFDFHVPKPFQLEELGEMVAAISKPVAA
jgi:CheY-like chemotaxis protein